MKMKRPPEALVEWFPRIVPRDPRVELRKMFGCPCAFVKGHMFCGIFEDRLFLRLPDDARERFLTLADAEPWRPMGRPMSGYVVAPPDLVEDAAGITPHLQEALAFAASLPPKAPKKPKARRAATSKASEAAAPKKSAAKAQAKPKRGAKRKTGH